MADQAMPNPVELYEGAAKSTRDYLLGAKPEQMGDSTPCSEWDVKALIEHVVGGAAYVSAALQGEEFTPGEGPENFVEAFDLHSAKVLAAMRSAENMERKIQTPGPELSGAEFSFLLFMDTLIHGWDLAKATGQNTSLPDNLVEVCNTIFGPKIDSMRGQVFGPAVEVPENSSTQDKLLGLMGRQP